LNPVNRRHVTRIRDARAGEAHNLSALAFRSKAHWGYSPSFMAACRRELTLSEADLANPAYAVRVAERGGSATGFHALARLSAEEFELDALFVDPETLGRGIGRALIEDAATLALAGGARAIIIQGDPHADGFYLKAGATRTRMRESGSIPGRMLPEYRLNLYRADGTVAR
jgi:GNAT superfamily N-acetyltransferase